ncbi:hypothetical protein GGR56DRAFT_529496 [Xylariaceae sp. FL0804]|nr:hypothetical protein GGR56DRAFT_529496 [Xylariaceae sp. FL0804]
MFLFYIKLWIAPVFQQTGLAAPHACKSNVFQRDLPPPRPRPRPCPRPRQTAHLTCTKRARVLPPISSRPSPTCLSNIRYDSLPYLSIVGIEALVHTPPTALELEAWAQRPAPSPDPTRQPLCIGHRPLIR